MRIEVAGRLRLHGFRTTVVGFRRSGTRLLA